MRDSQACWRGHQGEREGDRQTESFPCCFRRISISKTAITTGHSQDFEGLKEGQAPCARRPGCAGAGGW